MADPNGIIKKVRAYKVVMSKGDDIPFDGDELQNVVIAINNKQSVRLRQGFFNPSFYVSIVQDVKRVGDFYEDTRYDQDRRARGLEPLKDIFADLPKLGAPHQDPLRLNEQPRHIQSSSM